MKSDFSKNYPEFASIEKHIRRAHAERSMVIGTWIATVIVGGVRAIRGLWSPADPARRQRLVVRASVPR